MFDINKLNVRPATLDDVDFIVTTIVEAEKSSTDRIGPANYFEIGETEYKEYLRQMLEEEIDGCEVSISSFVVAEYEGILVAARGGWLEGANEDNMSSSFLKSNLFAYILPQDKLAKGQLKYDIVKDILIERELGAYQLEDAYTIPSFRGFHIMSVLDSYHIDKAKSMGVKKVQRHVCNSNSKSLKACKRVGFHIVKKYTSHHPLIKEFYPDDTMVLLEKEL